MNYPSTFLLIYFFVYFGLAFVWRSVKVYRETGINPIRLPRSDDAHGYVGRMFKGVLLLCLVYLSWLSFFPDIRQVLPPIAWLDNFWMQIIGWLVMINSCALLIWAQAQMGYSWRIGLDADTPGPLVIHGLFAYSRNPIFLSMRLNLLGLMCLQPNFFSLLLLVCGELLIQIQVRLEEAHLPLVYGEAYEVYRSRVPRWV